VSLAEGVGNLVENCSDAGAAIADVKLLLESVRFDHTHVGPAAILVSLDVDRGRSVGRLVAFAILLRDLNEFDAAGEGLSVLLDSAEGGVHAENVGLLGAAPVDGVVLPGSGGAVGTRMRSLS